MPVYQKVITSANVKNNSGAVFYGGNIGQNGATAKVASLDMAAAGYRDENYGSAPKDTLGAAVDNNQRVRASINYAKLTPRDFVIQNVANVNLGLTPSLAGDTISRRAINYNFNVITRKIVTTGWNYFTGKPLINPVPTQTDSFIRSGTADVETRSTPGGFSYVDGTLSPTVTDTYDVKTG